MLSKLRYFFVVMISSLTVISCSDDPSSIGSSLIDDIDKFNTIEISSDSLNQSSSFFQEDVFVGDANRLLLGKAGSIESSILARFYFGGMADSLREQITEDSIVIRNAWVKMKPTYYIGDKNSSFNYSVHNVTSNWTSGFNRDSLTTLSYDPEDISSSRTDTLFNISSTIVNNWLKAEADDEIPSDKGIYLKHNGAQKIIGYYAGTASGVYEPFTLYLDLEKPGRFRDTLTYTSLSSTDLHIVTGEKPSETSGYMFVQGGLAVHSKWKINIDRIPAYSVINSAVIEFYFDSTKSFRGSPPSDSLFISFDSAATTNDSSVFGLLKRDGDKFTGSVTYFVQQWVNKVRNSGLKLSLNPYVNEKSTIDLIALYDTNAADREKRPKLKILYSTKPR